MSFGKPNKYTAFCCCFFSLCAMTNKGSMYILYRMLLVHIIDGRRQPNPKLRIIIPSFYLELFINRSKTTIKGFIIVIPNLQMGIVRHREVTCPWSPSRLAMNKTQVSQISVHALSTRLRCLGTLEWDLTTLFKTRAGWKSCFQLGFKTNL